MSSTAPQHPSTGPASADDETSLAGLTHEGGDAGSAAPRHPRLRLVSADEAGTTTAEYTVVTAAAVAFGALLLKLLTGGWGQKILEVAFREVIKMLGF